MIYSIRRLVVTPSVVLLIALADSAIGQSKSPVAPSEQAYNNIVKQAYDNFKNDRVARMLTTFQHSQRFVTTDGRVYKVGDVDKAFSIQSISKVFTLALAMEELGADEVFKKVGSEPTGWAFNSIPAVVDMPIPAVPCVSLGSRRGCTLDRVS